MKIMEQDHLNPQDIILVTRAETDSQNFINSYLEQGFIGPLSRLKIAPLYRYHYMSPKMDYDFDADLVVVTSRNALEFLLQHKAYFMTKRFACVGEVTAQILCDEGFTAPLMEKTARELHQRLTEMEIHNLLYIRGAHIRHNFSDLVCVHGGIYKDMIVYEATLETAFSPEILKDWQDGKIRAVMLFSKRGAENLVHLIKHHGLEKQCTRTNILSISASVLESLGVFANGMAKTKDGTKDILQWNDMYVSKTPDQTGMYALIDEIQIKTGLFKN